LDGRIETVWIELQASKVQGEGRAWNPSFARPSTNPVRGDHMKHELQVMVLFGFSALMALSILAYLPAIAQEERKMPAHLREQVERLRSTDGFERYDAAMQLSRMGKDALPALPVLLEMLKDRDYVWTIYPHGQYVCSAATDALEQIGEEAVKPLVTVLETGGAGAREEAAIALGCMKNPEGIDALVSVLHDRNSPARTAAAVALAWIFHGPRPDLPSEAGFALFFDILSYEKMPKPVRCVA